MNTIDKIREIALIRCMKTKERYLDALYGVVTDEESMEFIKIKVIRTKTETKDLFNFFCEIKAEWTDFDNKMKEAGMR